jgi:hypothetical protein
MTVGRNMNHPYELVYLPISHVASQPAKEVRRRRQGMTGDNHHSSNADPPKEAWIAIPFTSLVADGPMLSRLQSPYGLQEKL